MRAWLERLFAAQGIECLIVLSWLDDPRCVSVLVDTGYARRELMREFRVEIESLVNCNEEQIIDSYVKPVANAIREAAKAD